MPSPRKQLKETAGSYFIAKTSVFVRDVRVDGKNAVKGSYLLDNTSVSHHRKS